MAIRVELFTSEVSSILRMCRTSEYAQLKLRLLSIYKSNVKIVLTAQELFSIEGIKIDRNTVAKYFACSSNNFAFTSLSFSLDSCQSYMYLMSLDCTFLARTMAF